jgi:hypothetical protein
LHGSRERPGIFLGKNQELDMVGCDRVVEDLKLVAFSGLKKPAHSVMSVACEFEEKSLLMVPMRDVPDIPRKKVAIGSWHWRKSRVTEAIKNLKTAILGSKWRF